MERIGKSGISARFFYVIFALLSSGWWKATLQPILAVWRVANKQQTNRGVPAYKEKYPRIEKNTRV
ncbi:hypothetical protein BLX87_01390 [Bacillus sp. VT-16-64]|nr:hypothetical protein BLX87_01390 [Bacillus sp. VT-16-64]